MSDTRKIARRIEDDPVGYTAYVCKPEQLGCDICALEPKRIGSAKPCAATRCCDDDRRTGERVYFLKD